MAFSHHYFKFAYLTAMERRVYGMRFRNVWHTCTRAQMPGNCILDEYMLIILLAYRIIPQLRTRVYLVVLLVVSIYTMNVMVYEKYNFLCPFHSTLVIIFQV